jgi:hypothetical protein
MVGYQESQGYFSGHYIDRAFTRDICTAGGTTTGSLMRSSGHNRRNEHLAGGKVGMGASSPGVYTACASGQFGR